MFTSGTWIINFFFSLSPLPITAPVAGRNHCQYQAIEQFAEAEYYNVHWEELETRHTSLVGVSLRDSKPQLLIWVHNTVSSCEFTTQKALVVEWAFIAVFSSCRMSSPSLSAALVRLSIAFSSRHYHSSYPLSAILSFQLPPPPTCSNHPASSSNNPSSHRTYYTKNIWRRELTL